MNLPAPIPRLCWIALSLWVSAGCEREYGVQACRMEREVELHRTRKPPISVAVHAKANRGFVAAYSADNGTWTVHLDAAGNPIDAPTRIQKARVDQALLPAESQRKTFWPDKDRRSLRAEHLTFVGTPNDDPVLLLLERPTQGRTGGAYAIELDSPTASPNKIIRLGPAYEYASRITADRLDNEMVVAWHEGHLDSSHIRLARIGFHPIRVKQTGRLNSNHPVFHPSLKQVRGQYVLAWSEIARTNEGPQSRVHVARINPALDTVDRVTIHKGALLESAPALAVAGNQVGIVYRDDADRDDILEYYFTLLNDAGTPVGAAKRISQADGWMGPSLAYSESRFVAATIRSFQRNGLVGLNQFDLTGTKLSGEFQVYADKSDFVRVDVAAQGNKFILVYAEDRRDSGRVLAARLSCRTNTQY